jgi:hypothetical protein
LARRRITGVVVNSKPSIGRREFDLLRAILYDCARVRALFNEIAW